MNKQLLRVWMLGVLMIAGLSHGQCEQIVTEDFEGSVFPDDKFVRYESPEYVYQMGDGRIGLHGGNTYHCAHMYLKDWTLDDYFVEVDMWPGPSPSDVAVRCTPGRQEYFVFFQLWGGWSGTDNPNIRLSSMFHNCGDCAWDYDIDKGYYNFARDYSRKYRLRVEAQGLNYKAFINGELVLQGSEKPANPAVDTLNHPSGPPGLVSCWGDPTYYDNFVAGPLGCSPVETRAPRMRANRRIVADSRELAAMFQTGVPGGSSCSLYDLRGNRIEAPSRRPASTGVFIASLENGPEKTHRAMVAVK